MNKASNQNITNWLLLLSLTLIWGSSYILIKKGLVAFAPIELGVLRLSLSFLATSPFLYSALKNKSPKNYWRILTVGLLGTGIPVFLFAFSTTKISSSVNGIINSLSPLFTVITGAVFFQLSIQKQKMYGVLIGLVGAMVLVIGRYGFNFNLSAYALLSVAATFCYGTNSNFVKQYFPQANALHITAIAMAMMGIPATFAVFGMGIPTKIITHPEAVKALLGVIFLAVFGTVIAWMIFYKLVQRTDALFAASVTYLIPIVALTFGLIDGEGFSSIQVLGMALILLGVYFVSRK